MYKILRRINMSWNESPYWRTARRWLATFVVGGIASLVAYLAGLPAEQQLWFFPLVVSVLMALDKGLREWL